MNNYRAKSLLIIQLTAILSISGCASLSPQRNNSAESISTVSLNHTTQEEKLQKIDPAVIQSITNIATLPVEIESSGINSSENELTDFDAQAIQANQSLTQLKINTKPVIKAEINQEIAQQAEVALQNENNAWNRLQSGMQMKPVMNKRVKAQLDWYLKHPQYLSRVMERASPILPFILDVINEKNMPTEMALLPIVESAYQSFAYSHGRASGMWQIIPSTGKHLGLKQNWWYDGRRDIIDSTHAATSYLQSLAKEFNNDWELALASYNAGPGTIRSAIRYNKKKGRKTDFWHLSRIRPETKNYVPKLLALKELFTHPDKYGLDLLHIEDEQSYELVELDSQIDLALAADLAGISTKKLYQMNPAFNRWATAPKGPHRLLLPKENSQQFRDNLAKLPKSKRVNWIRYKIKKGDSLSQIARKYRTSIDLIKSVNNIRKTNIRAGKYLLIPTATKSISKYTLSQSSRLNKIKSTSRKGQKITHVVKSGDSLWSISRHYKVNTRSLAKWNGMAPIDTLSIGQKLVIWKNSKAKAQRVSLSDNMPQHKLHALRYTVRKGDSLSRIAGKFNLSVSDIKKWNKIGKYLQPGQKLKLYVDITGQSG